MMRKNIFTLPELRAVTYAAYIAGEHHDFDWQKYLLAEEIKVDGDSAYEKYVFNLTDHGQDYFEDCMDVAVRDCKEQFILLADPNTDSEKRKRLESDINGWIEAAFEEFLE